MIAQSAFLLDNFNRLAEEAEYRHNYRNCHNRTSIAEREINQRRLILVLGSDGSFVKCKRV